MSVSWNSSPTIIQRLPGISYDIVWTGTPTGTFAIQVSNSYGLNSAGTWYSLPSSSFTGTLPAPAGSAGSGFIDVVGTEAYAIRLSYTSVSGNGTCTVLPAAKVL